MKHFIVDVCFGSDGSNTYAIDAETWQLAGLRAITKEGETNGTTDLRFALVYAAGETTCLGEVAVEITSKQEARQ